VRFGRATDRGPAAEAKGRLADAMRRLWWLLVLGALLPGCATASSEDRRAYILAHPHGWVEITISDPYVPDVPPAEDSDDPWQRPRSCGVSVELNEEPILYESAYPSGEAAPYATTTGFRFPAPVGPTELRFSYSGCRLADGKRASLELSAAFSIQEQQTHELVFDGAELSVRAPRPNEVVTLEDIYEAITGRRSPRE
jgi:hypothetical protein